MPCSPKGNHRSGIVLTMRYMLTPPHIWAQGLRKGDEHCAYTAVRGISHFSLLWLSGYPVTVDCYLGSPGSFSTEFLLSQAAPSHNY